MNYSTRVLEDCFNKAFKEKQPFLVCKHPKSTSVHIYQSGPVQAKKSKIKLQTFDSSKQGVEFNVSKHIILAAKELRKSFRACDTESFEEDFQQYKELFEKAQKFLNEGNQKIVISRKIEQRLKVDQCSLFRYLMSSFDNAFVYLLYHPLFDIWIGATPELLAEVNDIKLKTTALAGTTTAAEGQSPQWREKELLEQEIVQNELETQFKKHEISYHKEPTTNFKYGHLYHLKTDFLAELESHQKAVEAVSILHPTSAVCGFPRDKARAFILEHENYNRELYTGYIGIIHQCSASFYVNLRCMKIRDSKVSLFVGGGLNQSSILTEEFDETNQKAKVLLDILNVS